MLEYGDTGRIRDFTPAHDDVGGGTCACNCDVFTPAICSPGPNATLASAHITCSSCLDCTGHMGGFVGFEHTERFANRFAHHFDLPFGRRGSATNGPLAGHGLSLYPIRNSHHAKTVTVANTPTETLSDKATGVSETPIIPKRTPSIR